MTISERLASLGLELPAVPKPLAAYVPAVRYNGQIVTSGQLPMVSGELTVTGLVGEDVSIEQASDAAAICCLNALAAAADLAGGIDAIDRILKVVVYVASADGFTQQAMVANGASKLLEQLFEQAGTHARSAVGVAALPFNAPVELELTVAVS